MPDGPHTPLTVRGLDAAATPRAAVAGSAFVGYKDVLDRAFLDTLLKNAPAGIALLDPELRLLRINATFAKYHFLPAGVYSGRRLDEVSPRFPRRLIRLLEQVARTGRRVVNLRFTGVSGDSDAPGMERTLLASYYPVYEDPARSTHPGDLLGIGAIVVDIGDHKRSQEAALAAAARRNAEQMRQFLREILASVTEGRLHLCDSEADLPTRLPVVAGPFPLAKDSLRAPREALVEAAKKRDFPSERWQDLMTALGEATMNAVMHADGGAATIHATDTSTPDTRFQSGSRTRAAVSNWATCTG